MLNNQHVVNCLEDMEIFTAVLLWLQPCQILDKGMRDEVIMAYILGNTRYGLFEDGHLYCKIQLKGIANDEFLWHCSYGLLSDSREEILLFSSS